MRTLVLVRHAKAQAPDGAIPDHDRVLTPEGRTSASNLSRVLVAAGVNPERVIVSSALRAQQTWDIMKPAWPQAHVDVNEELYETHVEGVMELLREVDDSVETVMVVGHEPTTSATAAYLAGPGSDTPSMKRVSRGLPTGTAAVIEGEARWSQWEQRQAVLSKICAANVQY